MRYLLLVLTISCATFCSAQQLSYGVKVGLNIGTPIGPFEKGAKGTPGTTPLFGILSRYQVTQKWGVQVEALFSRKAARFSTPTYDTPYEHVQEIVLPDTTVYAIVNTIFNGDIKGKFKNTYIEVPIYATYTLNDRWTLVGGGYVSYLVEGRLTGTASGIVGVPGSSIPPVEDEPFDESQYIKTWDFGASLGADYKIYEGIFAGLRMTTGLTGILEDDYPLADGTFRNVYMQAMIGYRFNSNSQPPREDM